MTTKNATLSEKLRDHANRLAENIIRLRTDSDWAKSQFEDFLDEEGSFRITGTNVEIPASTVRIRSAMYDELFEKYLIVQVRRYEKEIAEIAGRESKTRE